MGGVIITLTRGMGEPMYPSLADSLLFRASGSSAVGVSVLKTLLLDTWVCAMATFSR